MVRDQISPPGDKISAVTDGVSRFVIPPARVHQALVVANAAMVLSGHEVAGYTANWRFASRVRHYRR